MITRRIAWSLVVLFACACGGRSEPKANENRYPMTATMVARDPAQNTVTLDNKDIPGVMEAMRMDYQVREAKVNSLPPNGAPVVATLHERDGVYWITDVRSVK
jgi:Copper binding periplasmic protein CusF